ncbi:Ubx4p [Sporobolomyces koalae]|uniref:Ubx4p n=1 Tax=Sporobolomyces koalae TaxID=500713 RepID=UPI00316D7B7F
MAESARSYELVSVSSVDPSKRRSFNCRYYLAPASDQPSSSSRFLDLPESYFNPTPVELQQAFAGQVKRREQLVDRPLLTQKLRDQQQAQHSTDRAAKWPHTRIRIRFADRSQLEGVFPSTDKLVHLYEFVKLALDPELAQTPFVLYQSPPRTEYVKSDAQYRGKTLIDLQFTPSCVLYIKFLDPNQQQFNDTSSRPPLKSEILEIAAPLPPPPSFDPTSTEDEGSSTKVKRENLGIGGDKGKVVPAWMRLGGKSGSASEFLLFPTVDFIRHYRLIPFFTIL